MFAFLTISLSPLALQNLVTGTCQQKTILDLPSYDIFAPQKLPLWKNFDDVISCDLWFRLTQYLNRLNRKILHGGRFCSLDQTHLACESTLRKIT